MCHAAQLATVKQMNRQVSRGSAVDYQPDEQAGAAGLICLILANGAPRHLSAYLLDNRQLSPATPAYSSA